MEADGITSCTLQAYEAKKADSIPFEELAVRGLYKGYFLTKRLRTSQIQIGAMVMDSVVESKRDQANEVGLDMEALNQDAMFVFTMNGNGIMTPSGVNTIRILGNPGKSGSPHEVRVSLEEGFLVADDLSNDLEQLTATVGLPVGV